MRSMTIEVISNNAEGLIEVLTKEFGKYRAGRMTCKAVKEDRKNQHVNLICSITHDNDGNTSDRVLNEFICNAVADYIINYYEVGLIYKVISSKYSGHNDEEQEAVLKIVTKIIGDVERRDIIIRSLSKYFEMAEDIVFEGFVNFRIKEYTDKIEEAVNRAVEEYESFPKNV